MRLTTCCPNCGHTGAVEERYPWIYGLTPHQREIMMILVSRPGQWVPIERIITLLYIDDEDGGPVTAEKIMHSQVHRIRKRLGNVVESLRGSGYRVHVDKSGQLLTMDQINRRIAA